MSVREVKEGGQVQATDEVIVYTIDVTRWGDTPINYSMLVHRISDEADVSGTVLSGSMSANGNILTCQEISNLVAGESYRATVKFDLAGNTRSCYFILECEKA